MLRNSFVVAVCAVLLASLAPAASASCISINNPDICGGGRGGFEGGSVGAISIGNVAQLEGSSNDEGARTNFNFKVTRSSSSGPASVKFKTQDGSAIAGSDYDERSGTLTFPDGVSVKKLTVKVIPDFLYECQFGGQEEPSCRDDFTVKLTNPSGATIADGTGKGRIENDDSLSKP